MKSKGLRLRGRQMVPDWRLKLMIVSLLLMLATEALPAAAAVQEVEEPNPKAMSRKEITAFNAKLSRDHPYYIRCVRAEETGSLVKKLYSCRTNEQWEASETRANDSAREMMDAFKAKSTNQSG